MSFKVVWKSFLQGKKIKRKNWTSYWTWKDGTIINHSPNGIITEINLIYVIQSIISEDWEVVE